MGWTALGRSWIRMAAFTLINLILLAGCRSVFPALDAARNTAPSNATAPVSSLPPASATPSTTPLPPSEAPLPTTASAATPAEPATQVSTATPTPHPMSIAALRARSYSGSDIIIEKELDRGTTYRRFYVSYLSDGLKIYALLTVPDRNMPPGGWPGLVFNHGYIPPRQYRATERYIAYVDWLARAGYVVLRIDYRGNDQSEGQATGAYGDPGYTLDVLNAVASLQRYPQVNPQKIGMWGHSMGGFLTLRAMVISKQIKAGVIWSGVVGNYTDMLYNWRRAGPTPTMRSDGRGWRSGWLAEYGAPEQNPAFWNALSANSYLADLSGPLQLHHGTADEEVPLAFSKQLTADLQAAGGTVEFYTYKDNDHNLSQSFETAMSRTIQFFNRYLK